MNLKRTTLSAMYGIVFSTVISLILLAVTITFLIQKGNQDKDVSVTSLQTVDSSDEFNGNSAIEILPVTDTKAISFNDENIILGQSYAVMSHFGNPNGTLFECSNKDCEIYEILSESGEYYYISPSSEIKINDGTIGSEEEFNHERFNLKAETLNLFDSDISIYRQIYGCLDNGLCVHSGELYIDDIDLNRKEVGEFLQFINSLQF